MGGSTVDRKPTLPLEVTPSLQAFHHNLAKDRGTARLIPFLPLRTGTPLQRTRVIIVVNIANRSITPTGWLGQVAEAFLRA